MFGNMVSKMKELQQILDDTKIRMESIYFETVSNDGAITIVMNANKKIKEISINEKLLSISDKEKLQENLKFTINQAMEKAEKIFESEMKDITKGVFPTFPFLF
jgi:hypothetical protein